MLILVLALTTAGCTSPDPADPQVPASTSSSATPDDAALTTFSYGPRPAQTADLILPASLAARTEELRTPSGVGGVEETGKTVDVVVLVHGGGWGAERDRKSVV